jgi:uncharacterized membrane protein
VSSQSIAQAARTLLSGSTVGQFREGDKLIDIVLRQPLSERNAISGIGNAYVPTASGKSIPLTQIAKPTFVWEPGVLWREGRDYAITVQGDIAEGLQGGVGNVHWLGDALGVLAAVLWGATTLVIRGSRLANAPPEQTLFYQLAVSGVLLVAGSLAVGEAWPLPSALGAQPLALMAFQTIVVTFASYLVWFWLVRHYPATQVASFTLLTPLAGLLAGVGLLGEPLTLRLLVACGTVAAGIVLVNRPPVAQAARAATQQA